MEFRKSLMVGGLVVLTFGNPAAAQVSVPVTPAVYYGATTNPVRVTSVVQRRHRRVVRRRYYTTNGRRVYVQKRSGKRSAAIIGGSAAGGAAIGALAGGGKGAAIGALAGGGAGLVYDRSTRTKRVVR